MYRALTPWWEGQQGMADTVKQLAFAPIPVPVTPLHLVLPERFVAVGFYARHTWPLTEELKTWVANLVDGIAKHVSVVLIESLLPTDDHAPFPITGPNITSIASALTLQNNLAVQSAVIAKAQCFVGTYGGLMQLAVRLKKPALGFYQKFDGTSYFHKVLTEWLGVQQQTPVFIGRPDDVRFVKDVMVGL